MNGSGMGSTSPRTSPAKTETVANEFNGVWDRFTAQINRLEELANRILGAQPPSQPDTPDMPMTLPNFAPRLEIQRRRLEAIIDQIDHLA